MIVGITTTYHADENYERANREYCEALRSCGFVPMMIPSFGDEAYAEEVCRSVDALVVTGGEDINQQQPTRRDEFEQMLVRAAYKLDVPTLGICRGMQIMNLALGGTLFNDIERTKVTHQVGEPYDQIAHLVSLRPGSTLYTLFGATLPVNSMHHQAVRSMPECLSCTSQALDGIAEGLESSDCSFFVGVQWHPEYLPAHKPLFEALFRAAQDRAAQPTRAAQPMARTAQLTQPMARTA